MKSEKDLIRSKYENSYPNLFQNMTDSLDNESMAYGDYLNKNTKKTIISSTYSYTTSQNTDTPDNRILLANETLNIFESK